MDNRSSNFAAKIFLRDWKRIVVVISPLILLWLPLISDTSEARCAYVILLMAIYYMTEALPLAVTALIPVFAFPLLGIMSTNEVCEVYLRGTAMMFFGGLTAAVAVEHCNLHKRIALFVILNVGQSPRKLMGSFLLTTMCLSMWISNTAAAAMMVPILDAILQELYKNQRRSRGATSKGAQTKFEIMSSQEMDPERLHKQGVISADDEMEDEFSHHEIENDRGEERLLPPDEEKEALSNMLFLATAYGANLGGTGSPTGTGANLVLWDLLKESFPEGTSLNFASWMAFNIPAMLLCVFGTWLWLEVLFVGICGCNKFPKTSKEQEESIRKMVQKHYDALGQVTFHEGCVAILFSILVCLWLFRDPEFIHGWASPIEDSFTDAIPRRIGNATPAILIVFLLFVVPSQLPWKNQSEKPTPACLTWEAVHKKVPWGLVLLMGGGFAMAEGSSSSGLSQWLMQRMEVLKFLPGQAIVFLVCFITTFLTEIISNITAASILLPVLRDMSLGIKMHPLYLMLPGAVCCSYAFMLPVANPPNAIAFNASTMKNSDMIKAGVVLNLMCVFIMTALINTLGVALFDLQTFPAWAQPNNTSLLLQLQENDTLLSYSYQKG